MIDVIGAITLTAIAVVMTGALALFADGGHEGGRRAMRLLVVGAAWFGLVVVLGAAGAFTRFGPIPVGVAVLAPIAIALASAAAGSTAVRAVALGVPVAVLIALNATRVLGGFFFLLHADGRLPATFTSSAGWGDIVAGVLAVPVAWLAYRRTPAWRSLALAWNAFALIDLVAAVTLGIGSAPDSPVRFIFEDTATGTLGTLPWVLIPAFLVPLYVLTHLAVFARLAADRRASHARVLADVRAH